MKSWFPAVCLRMYPTISRFCSDEELTFDRLKQLAYPSKPVLIKPEKEHGGLGLRRLF